MSRKDDTKTIITMLLIPLVLATSICVIAVVPSDETIYQYNLETFSSYEELLHFLEKNNKYIKENITFYLPEIGWVRTSSIMKESRNEPSPDFSRTNIQVEGVDEPDMVKTDGKYLYLVSRGKVYIVEAYPPEDAKILSNISLEEGCARNLFINDDRLVIFATSGYKVIVYLYDVTRRSEPILIKSLGIDGDYIDARMIGSHVYLVASDPIWRFYRDGHLKIPVIRIDGRDTKIKPNEVYHFNVSEPVDTMTHVVSLDIYSLRIRHKSFLIGRSHTIYVSRKNIYIVSTSRATTTIHKIGIDEGEIDYIASAEVPGYILNQFSIDEYKGFLGIATTTGSIWGGNSKNNIYILDENLHQVGKIEGLAPGEKIYSARFVGDRAYLVTFKKVDPFFVIDLSDPRNPKVLGELKIPGFSNYLHPYDEDHVIGIGKDTVEALPEEKERRGIDFAWYQGLKIALFDVTDPTNPKEISKVIIGDRGTSSPVLYNHKAFLFDREKELLVIPVSVCQIDEEIKERLNGYTGSIYGELVFRGVYVYNINLDDGIVYKGRITHGQGWDHSIKRSLYIGDILYTVSERMIKMNRLDTLDAVGEIMLS